jgi:hypothetical protein
MTTDPQPETALALLYRHGLPEDVIDGALCLHAQELAALQRTRMDELDLVGQKARIVGRIIDLIDPTKTPVSSAVAQSAETALRDRIRRAVCEAEAQQGVARQCVEYFLQSRETGGAWEDSSSFMVELDYAAERLAKRRNLVPGFEYRIAQRTTTVDVQPLPDCLNCRHWMCNGDGPCGALVDAWQRCPCTGPAVGAQQPKEADRG